MSKNTKILSDVKASVKLYEEQMEAIYLSDAVSALKTADPKRESSQAEKKFIRLAILETWILLFNEFDKFYPENFDKDQPITMQYPDYITKEGAPLPANTDPKTIPNLDDRKGFIAQLQEHKKLIATYNMVEYLDRVQPDLWTEFRKFVYSNYTFSDMDQRELLGTIEKKTNQEKRKKHILSEMKNAYHLKK